MILFEHNYDLHVNCSNKKQPVVREHLPHYVFDRNLDKSLVNK